MHGTPQDQMHVELQVAINFIVSYFYNKMPRTKIHLYGEELERLLRKKFKGHWYPSNPVKGSAFRCVHLNSAEIDPSFELAAVSSGLDFVIDVKKNLPAELRLWVDPGEVSYAIGSADGKPGHVNVLYREPPSNSKTEEQAANSTYPHGIQAPHAAPVQELTAFNPHAKDFLPKAATKWVFDAMGPHELASFSTDRNIYYNQRPQRKLYTVDEFASTKFGSTKTRPHARNFASFQRMQPPNYQLHPNNDVFYPAAMPSMCEQQYPAIDRFHFFQPQRESGSSSLTASSLSASSSPGSSTSSSPDHVKGQLATRTNRAPMSPTSPWGNTFTLPTAIYNPVDTGSQEETSPETPSSVDGFIAYTAFNDFVTYKVEGRVPKYASESRVLSCAK